MISGTGIRPSISQLPSSRRTAQASSPDSGPNSPVMASSTSRSVITPCTAPYSSTTNTSCATWLRKWSSSSMPDSVSGTKTGACNSSVSTGVRAFGQRPEQALRGHDHADDVVQAAAADRGSAHADPRRRP